MQTPNIQLFLFCHEMVMAPSHLDLPSDSSCFTSCGCKVSPLWTELQRRMFVYLDWLCSRQLVNHCQLVKSQAAFGRYTDILKTKCIWSPVCNLHGTQKLKGNHSCQKGSRCHPQCIGFTSFLSVSTLAGRQSIGKDFRLFHC